MDLLPGVLIEVPGRLVGENRRGLHDHRSKIATRWRSPPESWSGRCRDRPAMPNSRSSRSTRTPLLGIDPGQHQRQLHVFRRGQPGNEMEELENELILSRRTRDRRRPSAP